MVVALKDFPAGGERDFAARALACGLGARCGLALAGVRLRRAQAARGTKAREGVERAGDDGADPPQHAAIVAMAAANARGLEERSRNVAEFGPCRVSHNVVEQVME